MGKVYRQSSIEERAMIQTQLEMGVQAWKVVKTKDRKGDKTSHAILRARSYGMRSKHSANL